MLLLENILVKSFKYSKTLTIEYFSLSSNILYNIIILIVRDIISNVVASFDQLSIVDKIIEYY